METIKEPVGKCAKKAVNKSQQKPLIIMLEDDADEAQIAVQALEQNYECTVFETISSLRRGLADGHVEKDRVRAFVVDLNLSDGDGLSVIPEVKRRFPEHPVIILSSRTTTSNKVAGFVMGVDDYITKPIDPVEFLYRMNTRISKALNASSKESVLQYKSLTLDFQALRVYTPRKKEGIELSANETKLLALLLRNPGTCFSRAQILEKLWRDVFVSDRTIDSHISHLRKKIKDADVSIHSIYGSGYKLV